MAALNLPHQPQMALLKVAAEAEQVQSVDKVVLIQVEMAEQVQQALSQVHL
tara:strand:- start:195 stop:347 length:153 start_codon:yes stop_codon:yes gene_type:complete